MQELPVNHTALSLWASKWPENPSIHTLLWAATTATDIHYHTYRLLRHHLFLLNTFIWMARVKKGSTLHAVRSVLLYKDCWVTLRNEIHLRCDGSEAATQLPLIKRGCLVKSLGLSATKPVVKPPFPRSWCCCDGLLLTTGERHSMLWQREPWKPTSSPRGKVSSSVSMLSQA